MPEVSGLNQGVTIYLLEYVNIIPYQRGLGLYTNSNGIIYMKSGTFPKQEKSNIQDQNQESLYKSK